MGGANSTTFRISPGTLRLAEQGMPFNTVARQLFDRRVVFDVAEALGVARDRLVVTFVHPQSGITTVECIPSRLPADPTCGDLVATFQTLIGTHGSQLYDGVLLWAIDPLYPGDEHVAMIDGVPYADGSCSNPRWVTEDECLSMGVCRCSDVPPNDRKLCENSVHSRGMQTPCEFLPMNTWTPGALRPIVYGHCSDPTKRGKEECLEEGECSDARHKGRSACLADGVCTPDPNDASESDMSQYMTREECEKPETRRKNAKPAMPKGACGPKPGTDQPDFWYGQFTNRPTCEQPEKRGHVEGLTPPSEECGTCGGGPTAVAPFSYGNFKTKLACENPDSRTTPVRGACAMQYEAQEGVCLPRPGTYPGAEPGRWPSNFGCEKFPNKTTCEDRSKRPVEPCTTTSGHPTGGHCAGPQFWVRGANWTNGASPDLRIPIGYDGGINREGPQCVWKQRRTNGASIDTVGIGAERGHQNANCGNGPAGKWTPADDCEKAPGDKGPPGLWRNTADPAATSPFDPVPGPPGIFKGPNFFQPINVWFPAFRMSCSH